MGRHLHVLSVKETSDMEIKEVSWEAIIFEKGTKELEFTVKKFQLFFLLAFSGTSTHWSLRAHSPVYSCIIVTIPTYHSRISHSPITPGGGEGRVTGQRRESNPPNPYISMQVEGPTPQTTRPPDPKFKLWAQLKCSENSWLHYSFLDCFRDETEETQPQASEWGFPIYRSTDSFS